MSVAGIKTLLLDRNSAPPKNGHADGLDRRSFEILDMFNLGQTIWQEAHQTIEVSYWVRHNITTASALLGCALNFSS